jgi:hypothetical protein
MLPILSVRKFLLEVNDQLELHGLLHGQVSRLGPFQDLVHRGSGSAPPDRKVRRIGHEAPSLHIDSVSSEKHDTIACSREYLADRLQKKLVHIEIDGDIHPKP